MVKLINNIVKYKILFLMLIFLNSCCDSWLYPDDELSIKRMDYTGNELRIEGYYYYGNNGIYYDIYFLYHNGIILYCGGSHSNSELKELEIEFASGYYYNFIKNTKYHWGAFKIENNLIQFERWFPYEGGLPVCNRSGVILNDSTFHITKAMRADGTEQQVLDETFHFKRFSPKPDSTNKFVK